MSEKNINYYLHYALEKNKLVSTVKKEYNTYQNFLQIRGNMYSEKTLNCI